MYPHGYYSGASYAAAGFVVLAVAITALVVLLVLPKEKDGKLPYVFQLLHDAFSPKKLVIEKIVQVLYVFFACLSVLTGIYSLLAALFRLDMMRILLGLFLIVVAPILLRLVYELVLLLVIQVKTTREISQKLSRLVPEAPAPETPETPPEGPAAPEPQAPAKAPEGPAPVTLPSQMGRVDQGMAHCPACGTWYRRERKSCPICGGSETDN